MSTLAQEYDDYDEAEYSSKKAGRGKSNHLSVEPHQDDKKLNHSHRNGKTSDSPSQRSRLSDLKDKS